MDLSIILLSYNTRKTTVQTLKGLTRALASDAQIKVQIVVVDNASTDGSGEEIQKLKFKSENCHLQFIQNKTNEGFSKGNNRGLEVATGKYVLYLNSDMNVDGLRLSELVTYMDTHQKVGIVTPRVNLTSGQIDPASHRGFPTPWRSLCYFVGLGRFFAPLRMTSRWFGGYHLHDKNLDTEHEIESCTGAFLLVRGDIVRELGGFDERFFMYGEDLDLCFRVKEKGLQVIWLPTQKVVHLKYTSGIGSTSTETRNKIRAHFYEAMWLFYEKHYSQRYPMWVSVLVRSGIWLKSYL